MRVETFGPKIGDYIVEEELGRGASSLLFRARHDVLDEVVALKVLRDSRYIESLRREAKILHKLKHPSIVSLRTVSLKTDPAFLALELIEGESLQDHLGQGKRLDIDEALRIALAVLSALEALHDLRLVHGDLKPANILLGHDRSVKLVDFGFSYDIEDDDHLELSADLADFQAKKRWGTFAYAAPELIKGEELDGRADLYSLAVVIFEMVTGQRPEPGDKPSDLRPELPAFLDEIFLQCYCRKEKRYVSARELSSLIRPHYKGSTQKQSNPEGPDGVAKAVPVELLQRAKKMMEAGAFEAAEEALEELKSKGYSGPSTRALRDEFEAVSRRVLNGRNKEELRRSLGEYDELLALLLKRIELTPRDKKLYAETDQLKRRLQKRTELLEDVRNKHELGYSAEARGLLEDFLEDLPGDRQCRLALSEIESYEKRVALVLESAREDKLSDPRWRLGQVQKLLKDMPRHESLLRLQAELKAHIQTRAGIQSGPRVLGLILVLGLIFAVTGWFQAQAVQDRSYALLQSGDWKRAQENFESAAFFVPWFLTAESEEKLKDSWESEKAKQARQQKRDGAGNSEFRPDKRRPGARQSPESSGSEKERRPQ